MAEAITPPGKARIVHCPECKGIAGRRCHYCGGTGWHVMRACPLCGDVGWDCQRQQRRRRHGLPDKLRLHMDRRRSRLARPSAAWDGCLDRQLPTGGALAAARPRPEERTSRRLTRQDRRPSRGGVGAKTERVERSIRNLIASEDLGPGGRLPSERHLAEQLDAGRTTIRLVLMKLATEGLIRSEHGRGYFAISSDHAKSDSTAVGSPGSEANRLK
jgi:Bacterial regulatory proteins, gntR family